MVWVVAIVCCLLATSQTAGAKSDTGVENQKSTEVEPSNIVADAGQHQQSTETAQDAYMDKQNVVATTPKIMVPSESLNR